jgi:prepilin-type processing-associated H-X9-DG protein
VSLASITDGTSNTIAFGEVANGLIPLTMPDGTDSGRYGLGIWAFAGFTPGESSWFATMYGVNPQKRAPINQTDYISYFVPGHPWMMAMSATSFHPGGANFGMADGSVRFIKETIASFPLTSNPPAGMYYSGYNTYALNIGMGAGQIPTLPVFQALSTIGGGEVVSGDAY